MTNHSYKGLTQPLQIDTANPHPARHRVLGATTVAAVTAAAAVRCPAAAGTETGGVSVQLFTWRVWSACCVSDC